MKDHVHNCSLRNCVEVNDVVIFLYKFFQRKACQETVHRQEITEQDELLRKTAVDKICCFAYFVFYKLTV